RNAMLGAEPVRGFLAGVSDIGPDGGYRLPRGDGVGSRGRRGSIFVLISTREVFLPLLAGMSPAGATKTRNFYEHGPVSRSTAIAQGARSGKPSIGGWKAAADWRGARGPASQPTRWAQWDTDVMPSGCGLTMGRGYRSP